MSPVDNPREYCNGMLPKVSRTFALCIRLLPRDLEYPVLLAYLLCRIADTIEDSTQLEPAAKAGLLLTFGRAVTASDAPADPFHGAFDPSRSDEDELAHHANIVLAEFGRLPDAQQECIAPWVGEMCEGMAEFAGDRSRNGALTVGTVEELERYCYYVAGTVGHLLTELFALRGGFATGRRDRLRALATRFGLGLQLTNIIKDVSDDRARGWTFVPLELCRTVGLEPGDLHRPEHQDEARGVMDQLIGRAEEYLHDALEYCTTIPNREYGVRLFCLTSMYFAVRTLRLARADDRLLDPDHKVKISRPEVYGTLLTTSVVAPFNPLVRTYFKYLESGGSSPGPR